MKSIQIKFQKYDKFGNAVFITREGEAEYNQVRGIHEKIDEKFPDATSFVYVNDIYNYATIRIMKQNKFKFVEKNTYLIDFQTKKVERNDRTFINAKLISSKLTKKYTQDFGEDVEI